MSVRLIIYNETMLQGKVILAESSIYLLNEKPCLVSGVHITLAEKFFL